MVMPGESADLKLTILRTMPIQEGQNFTLREGNLTVGTGIITKRLPAIHVHRNTLLKDIPLPEGS